MTRRTRHSLKGNAVSRQLFALAGAFLATVAVAVPSATPKMTAKQAALKGQVSSSGVQREQIVSRMIVKMRGTSPSDLAQPMSASRMQGLSATAGVSMKSMRAMAGSAALLALDAPLPLSEAKTVAARLALDPSVEYAEPDIVFKKVATPNETRFNDWQWNLFAPSSTYTGALFSGGAAKSATTTGGANLPLAWDVTTGNSNVVLAVLDTGIVNHQDLNGAGITPFSPTYVPNGRFLAGYDFISEGAGAPLPLNFAANDGDGRDADPSDPGDWITKEEKSQYPQSECVATDESPPYRDSPSSWHGSHMAGVAAATANNASGIAGIGWNIRILPVRVLGKCGGSLSDIAEAIRWAAGVAVAGVPVNSTPAHVISLSLGVGLACPATLQSAVDAAIAAGAVVVAATGNEGVTSLSAPSNCSGVISVTAHTINGENATYANIGSQGGTDPRPSISAPGGGPPIVLGSGGPTDDEDWFGYYIWSTVLFGDTTPNSGGGPGGTSTGPAYVGAIGTSAATPQVAAVAALVKSLLPNASSAQVLSFVVANSRPHPDGGACAAGGALVGQCGPGLLDANAVVRAAALVAPPQPVVVGGTPPPTGGGGGGGALPFWQLLLLGALSLAARTRTRN
jgi:serine protease